MNKYYFLVTIYLAFLGSTSSLQAQLRLEVMGDSRLEGKLEIIQSVGDSSVFIGANAGINDDGTNNRNTFVGVNSGFSNTTGFGNTFSGSFAGYSNTIGYANTFLGSWVGYNNTTGIDNTFSGSFAGFSNTTGYGNTFSGNFAGQKNTSGHNNTFLGNKAGKNNTIGDFNTFSGFLAGLFNTAGSRNTFSGSFAGVSNTTGSSNIAIGVGSLYRNTDRSHIVAVGDSVLYNNGLEVTASFHATANTAIGSKAGYSNTTGYSNTFSGSATGYNNTTGNSNTFSGSLAGYNNTTGNFRTGFGYSANSAGEAYNNSMGLGYNANCTAAHQVRLGNIGVISIGGYANWTNVSDARFKGAVQEDVKGLEFIKQLRPVTYQLELEKIDDFFAQHYQERDSSLQQLGVAKGQIRYTGFIAQEVEAAAKEIGYDFSGVDAPKNDKDFYGLRYAEFVVPLVKAVQELDVAQVGKQGQIAALQAELETIQQENQVIKAENQAINERLSKLETLLWQLGKDMKTCCLEDAGDTVQNQSIRSANNSADASNLAQNIPNPFDTTTSIAYYVNRKAQAAYMTITELPTGKEVRRFVLTPGKGSVVFHAGNASNGAYSYSLVVDGQLVETKRMILVK